MKKIDKMSNFEEINIDEKNQTKLLADGFTGERMIPGIVDEELEIEHKLRYHFASQFVEGKKVLDAACGSGYGTSMLAKTAKHVKGIDISKDAIEHAKIFYSSENIEFSICSVDTLIFDDKSFDVIVSFETLEHVPEDIQLNFLKEIKRVLKPEGILIMSTPNHDVYKLRGENHFHVKELTFDEFSSLIRSNFKEVAIYNQAFEISCSITANSIVENSVNINNVVDFPEYLIAVCSDIKLKEISSFSLQRAHGSYKKMLDWAVSLHNSDIQKQELIDTQSSKLLDFEKIQQELLNKSGHVDLLLQRERDLNNIIANKDNKIHELSLDTAYKDGKIDQLNVYERELRKNIEEKVSAIKVLEQIIDNKNKSISEFEQKLVKKNEEIKESNQEIEKKMQAIYEFKAELANKVGHIDLLLESDRELNRIKNTKSWRIMCAFWKIRSKVFPVGSKRTLFVKLVVKFVKHPIRFIKKLSLKRVKLFFKTLKNEGALVASDKVNSSLIDPVNIETPIEVVNLKSSTSIGENSYEKIILPTSIEPLVSIIIPVYNQFEYTYLCLKSIIENTKDVNYEVIIADDCSTDKTAQILEVVNGIKVIKTPENLRFLRNCNNAAKHAIGKYILFLNNDTQVQKDWLSSLVALIEKDDNIGMVGSKLVYSDGKLQEAGGILWKDGSAWNYGNKQDPNLPEFNYVKEVDYISGAAIMIRQTLWRDIGGFDDDFAPAYYEDGDLAFEVRKKGYKVVYQPLSVVVHFEGVSNGTDTSSGQKSYQVVNNKKFYDKWKNILEKEHFQNAENVFLARNRGQNKKTILVVDHYVPHHDKDAGSKCTFMYIKLFVELGMNVVFIGDNFYPHQPYTQELQQMGVFVLYGDYYYNNWKTWIKENGKYFDYAYLNRPHISEKYIDILKKNSEAKIIYFGHDLHFLREYREYEITKDSDKLKSSNDWKKREFDLFTKADVVYVVGSFEQALLKKEFPDKIIQNIPLYIYEGVRKDINRNWEKRKNIMFVGGFGHPPNEDAVMWFAENVFQNIVKTYPDIIWYIIGSKPPQRVKDLTSKNIVITGFVSDEELDNYYATCRLAVVPLRVGAGVKGKVVEATYNQIPLLTTPIGAEGLSLTEGAFVVAEPTPDMAIDIIELYENFDKLNTLSMRSKEFLENHFTTNVAKNIVKKDIII